MARFVVGMRSLGTLLAFETKLGWCLVGSFNDADKNSFNMNNVAISMFNTALNNLWELEPLGIEQTTKVEEAGECIKHFEENVEMADDGHYNVALPWIEGHPPLPSERRMAEVRLWQVLRRVERTKMYDAVLQEWEDAGIIERVHDEDEENTGHYLPHRPIVKEGKTTKIRPVFDASAKCSGSVSLNECLHKGPNMISNLMKLLLRFRLGKVGVISDIKQAFLMIRLSLLSDKDMLRFLWWRDGRLITLQHCRVVFGLSSSPFLLNATIAHHLQKFDSAVSERLKNSFYVDDCVTSVSSLTNAEDFKKEASALMLRAGFDLRGWVFSGDRSDQQVLGIHWSSQEDTIRCCRPKFEPAECYSKKELLSLVGRVYDPLGLLSAPMLYLKLLLQECFKRKLSWDEPVPNDIQLKINQWLAEVDLMSALLLQRCLIGNDVETATLHVFSDASKVGLGSCVFLRCQIGDNVKGNFVASNARVCPIEHMTIPRLELTAALLAARFAKNVAMAIDVLNVTFWTDSMISLYWIKGGEWKTFVGNRVKEIRALTDSQQWRFVEGERNPADVVSRGCLLSEYLSSRWFAGPDWLKCSPAEWPTVELLPCNDALAEQRVFSMVTTPYDDTDNGLFYRISSYRKTKRVVALVQRFIYKMRKRSTIDGPLIGEELEQAEITLLRWVQRCQPLDLQDMETTVRSDGLVRVLLPIRAIVLPHCSLVEALIRECHQECHHASVSTVLGVLREKYWVIRGRRLVRNIIKKCIRCRLFKEKTIQTPPIGLPDSRVNLGKAFEVCGCDLTGPLFLKNQSKVWVVLFTCAVYRAVHLELVGDISTEAFLLALQRMIARRGRVRVMYSDNGTNFVGAARLINAEAVEDSIKIQWIFNPPAAPWWGGFFERLVGVMKTMLKATLGRALLNLVELTTIIIEIEAVMNARPITYHSDDPSELRPITPSVFLQEETNTNVADLDQIDEKGFAARSRYVCRVRTNLKERFRREYLGLLYLRTSKSSVPIKIGEVVWVNS